MEADARVSRRQAAKEREKGNRRPKPRRLPTATGERPVVCSMALRGKHCPRGKLCSGVHSERELAKLIHAQYRAEGILLDQQELSDVAGSGCQKWPNEEARQIAREISRRQDDMLDNEYDFFNRATTMLRAAEVDEGVDLV